MTPARVKALQWFHDRGKVRNPWLHPGAPTLMMIRLMMGDRQLTWAERSGHFLTNKGHVELHEATRK